METIKIKTPIWKTKSVGIAERKMIGYYIAVEVEYTNKQGDRLYPGVYFMKKEKALTYPTQIVKGVTLRIIPIEDFIVCPKGFDDGIC